MANVSVRKGLPGGYMKAAAWIAGAVLMSAACARAAASGNDLVRAELLADRSAIKAGEPFTLGVLLHITPGWHIYWSNPGDSGLATSVKWKLPRGFQAAPLQFPVPRRLDAPGDLVNYGYEDQVLLLAKITPPGDLKPGADVSIAAETRWLCCKELCLPGSTKLHLILPVSKQATPANEALFRTWESQVPVETVTSRPEVARAQSGLDANGRAHIVLHWARMPREVQLFPTATDALAVSNISIKTTGDITTITFKLDRLQGQQLNPTEYPVVIGYTDPAGERRGLVVKLPVR